MSDTFTPGQRVLVKEGARGYRLSPSGSLRPAGELLGSREVAVVRWDGSRGRWKATGVHGGCYPLGVDLYFRDEDLKVKP